MNTIIVTHPAPACILPVDHPARAWVPAVHTDVARTFSEHAVLDLMDDYERTDALGYLEQAGAFR